MSDLFAMFEPTNEPLPSSKRPMTSHQRAGLRELFERIGLTTASAQFDLVYELTGTRPKSVLELDERSARALLVQLRHRVQTVERGAGSGSAWADRDEDTWIDKL